jgi:Zn-dependent peptidase ImmA (M78 family)
LFHECGHLLLAKPGVCLPDEGQVPKSKAVETFCNRFAAALLIPQAEIEQLGRAIRDSDVASAAKNCASRYHVSRFAVLGRMQSLGLISQQDYNGIAQKWSAGTKRTPARGGGGESPVDKCIRQRGRRLAGSILEGAERNLITATDAIRYLDIKLTDLGALRSKLRPRSG